ncbi:ABC transporter substrate-binding protein [Brachybacterium sp. AOP29-B2-41]|uniref:ABC transporter substrate-binding protein n=1 Tax=Brachybacterium sp. AOP29-B2-41 TaxID=3457704 RepID=UPI00403390AF
MTTTPRTTRRTALGLAAAAPGLALLAGCSGSGGADPAGESAGGSERTFAIAVQSGPNSLDPAQLVDGQQMFVWASVLDTLLTRDRETGDVIPHAAESFEHSSDGTILTLTLREGMTFSDGSPVDAAAVAATMERTRATPGPVQAKYDAVEEVVAADDLTVEVRFSAYDPQFVYNLTLGAGAIGHPPTLDEERTATDPVGSGPFTLDVAASVPGTSYVLKKREDHWNAAALPVSTFTVRVLQDATASFNALQAGEIDAASVRAQMLAQLDQETFTISEIPASSLVVLDILDRGGEQWPALGDVRVRQALNHAVDRDDIVTGLLGGQGLATQQVFGPDGEVNDPALDQTFPHDAAAAAGLVEEAGATGTVFQIPSTFLSTPFEPALSQAFQDAGLELEWVSVPPQQAQSAHLSGDFPLSVQIVGVNSDPADAFYHYAQGGFGNPRNYVDPILEEAFTTINTTVEFDDAVEAYRTLNAHAVQEALEVPLAFTGQSWAARDGVTVATRSGIPSTIGLFDFGS